MYFLKSPLLCLDFTCLDFSCFDFTCLDFTCLDFRREARGERRRGERGFKQNIFCLFPCKILSLQLLFADKRQKRVLEYHVKTRENEKQVSVAFMVLGMLFTVCLIVSNIIEQKLIQIGPIEATAGLLIFPFLTLLMT